MLQNVISDQSMMLCNDEESITILIFWDKEKKGMYTQIILKKKFTQECLWLNSVEWGQV